MLFLEEIIVVGGYFRAVEQGFFVDSGYYPQPQRRRTLCRASTAGRR